MKILLVGLVGQAQAARVISCHELRTNLTLKQSRALEKRISQTLKDQPRERVSTSLEGHEDHASWPQYLGDSKHRKFAETDDHWEAASYDGYKSGEESGSSLTSAAYLVERHHCGPKALTVRFLILGNFGGQGLLRANLGDLPGDNDQSILVSSEETGVVKESDNNSPNNPRPPK